MKKRTKIIILAAMVVLLGVTGYLNIVLNNSIKDTATSANTTTSYFSAYRNDRQSTRDQELLYYDAIIYNEAEDQAAKDAARAAKQTLMDRMDMEMVCENLIKVMGFSDCVVAIGQPNINVVVQAQTLTQTEAGNIIQLVHDQTHVQKAKIFLNYAD